MLTVHRRAADVPFRKDASGRFIPLAAFIAALAACLTSCRYGLTAARAGGGEPASRRVSVVPAKKKNLQRRLTVSSELVPFQQIDVFAKEAGFVRRLNVDYGSQVRTGDVLAILEIPELQIELDEDDADIADAAHQISRAQQDVDSLRADYEVQHLLYTRLKGVAQSRPGLIAQQELDAAHGKDLTQKAQVRAAESALESAQSRLSRAQAKRRRDQVIFDYSRIVAPFDGVVTQRYANLGTLMQTGTNSSTQVLPLVQLSENDRFRLVIPVPESYVRYIRVGDPVDVRVPSLEQHFPGRVTRFSVDVRRDTRTMHTEVDVPNPKRVLMPGVYAEATLTLDRREDVVTVPPEAILPGEERSTVWVVDRWNRVELRDVTVGLETPEAVEVTSGLKGDELVVVGDRSSLRPGEAVNPRPVRLLRYRGEEP